MFVYPRELIERVRFIWKDSKRSHEKVLPRLPSDKMMTVILETTYHASFLKEEGRQTSFRIAYCLPAEIHAENALRGLSVEMKHAVELSSIRPFNREELLRLAPACDPTRTLIGISSHRRKGKGDNGLHIWGIIDAGSSWWRFTQMDVGGAMPPPNCFTVSSDGPGHLTISRHGTALVTLTNGEIYRLQGSVLYLGPIADFLASAKEFLQESVYKLLGQHIYYAPQEAKYPQRVYCDYLTRLLTKIQSRGHGGAVYVVPEGIDGKSKDIAKILNIKYPCQYMDIYTFLIVSLALKQSHYHLWKAVYDLPTVPQETYQQEWRTGRICDDIDDKITDTIAFLSALSGVDGGIVITDRFRLLGFGAEVIAPPDGLQTIYLSNDLVGYSTVGVSIENYGTRHRSAFRLCNSNQELVAFIMSQDGGIKAMKRVGKRVLVWRDIFPRTLAL